MTRHPARPWSAAARWPWFVLFACLLVAGCTSSDDDEPRPAPTRSAVLDTIARSDVGDRLTVTATVTRVLSRRAVVLRDVDLPPGGLLVLGDVPAGLRTDDLVTVVGRIDRFAYQRFGPSYRLGSASAYAPFEGAKALVAESFRSEA